MSQRKRDEKRKQGKVREEKKGIYNNVAFWQESTVQYRRLSKEKNLKHDEGKL